GMNGVVHHALAFNTLLSSQETDAFTLRQTRRPAIRGVRYVLFCVSILSGSPGLRETSAIRTVSA
ncbi:hypothetical protein AB0M44_32005, partial [Streptosporangium subroseum]|uniref:hypothetical protein n=1 Tax=Streptosporangium subroseum TaxID=106412 RepID=UPI00341423DB